MANRTTIMSESPTPRTDAEFEYCSSLNHPVLKPVRKLSMQELERELAEAREDAANQRRLADMVLAHRDVIIAERDTLEEALERVSRQRSNRYESTVGVVCDIADEALAAVKGGLHD